MPPDLEKTGRAKLTLPRRTGGACVTVTGSVLAQPVVEYSDATSSAQPIETINNAVTLPRNCDAGIIIKLLV